MFESACLSLEQWRFFRSWVANPLRVAAVAPSSDSLARIMTNEITPLHSPVLELGAGTGVFTRALLNRGVPEEALTLVEFGSEFARLLQFRFPRARVLWMDASQLAGHNIFQERSVGAVVSGLPLLSMTPRKVMSILIVAFLYIRADGAFYQFTYGPRCPISRSILDRLGLKARRIGGTVRNLPPAAVYRITRRPPPRGLAGNPGIFLAAPRYPIDCGVSQHLKFSVTT
ncbi:class I SAM-dependent methyltransferase [Rhodomicrobium vannielii]|uniref:class I SAM-dependent methyltransferase n=1 Tax=Rhodomicrobium vannielii TaxID=1069 RepID=UPI001FD9694D|nr:phospholipid methyltransferase [Rhodomicrobium vannielii]